MQKTIAVNPLVIEINNEVDSIPCFPDLVIKFKLWDKCSNIHIERSILKDVLAFFCGGFWDGNYYRFVSNRGAIHFTFLIKEGFVESYKSKDTETATPIWDEYKPVKPVQDDEQDLDDIPF